MIFKLLEIGFDRAKNVLLITYLREAHSEACQTSMSIYEFLEYVCMYVSLYVCMINMLYN